MTAELTSPDSGKRLLSLSPSPSLFRSISRSGLSPAPTRPDQILTPGKDGLPDTCPFSVRRYAFEFDGEGSFHPKVWEAGSMDGEEITALVSNGPYCANLHGTTLFRINSAGPLESKFTLRIAARITDHSIISVALGRVPRLEFSRTIGEEFLTEIPHVLRKKKGKKDTKTGRVRGLEVEVEAGIGVSQPQLGGTPLKTPSKIAVRTSSSKTPPPKNPSGRVTLPSGVEGDKEEGEGVGLIGAAAAAGGGGGVGAGERETDAEFNDSLMGTNGCVFIDEEVLEELLRRSHPQEADSPIPERVGQLAVHLLDTFVSQLQDGVVDVETEVDRTERVLDTGGAAKGRLLKDRTFPKMHLDLQRILQAIAHSEVVFPKIKDKMGGKKWCGPEEMAAMDGFMASMRRCKENVGFLASRITALQASLDQWQAEQINRKLYYLSFLSMVFLPLSIVTGLFGMNVGGVPWVPQTTQDPKYLAGFWNVLLLCVFIVLFMLAIFVALPTYSFVRNGLLNSSLWQKFLRNRKLRRALRLDSLLGPDEAD